jgi:glycosyltransferase involved in cell wall biosynthesis
MPNAPLISVILTIYNYGHFLARVVASINAQANTNFEVIFVNDGSTDNTHDWLEQNQSSFNFAYQIVHQENQGKGQAAWNGTQIAVGTYCLFLDADDELLPDAIDAFERHITKNQAVEALFANHASARTVAKGGGVKHSQNPAITDDIYLNLKLFLIEKRLSFATGAYVFKRQLVAKYFYSKDLSVAEDIPFEAHLLANCHCSSINESTVLIHKHEDSRRHNWQGYYRDYHKLINEVFDEQKLDKRFFSLKSAFKTRVIRSLFNKLYRAAEYNKAVTVFGELGCKQRVMDYKNLYRYIVCLIKRN